MVADAINWPRLAAPRYRALGIVVLVHLALGWWLIRSGMTVDTPMRRVPLAPVLIQDVMIAPPALVPQAPARSAMRMAPTQEPARAAVGAERPPAAPVPPSPSPSPNPAPAPTRIPTPTPVLPSAEPAVAPAAAPAPAAVGPSAASSVEAMPLPTPSAVPAVPASGLARSGQPSAPLPSSAQASRPSGPVAGPAARPADIALVCPTQVSPVMPRLAVRGGITGVVQAQAVIVHGVVREVRILSGPSIFHNAVRVAMGQYRCESTRSEVLATQEFIFKVD